MKILFIVYLSLILFFALAWGSTFIYWKFFKKQFTRERFAFIAVEGYIVIALVILPYLMEGSIINIVISLLNQYLEMNFELLDVSISEKLLGMTIPIIYTFFTVSIFKNWKGDISLKHFNENRVGKKSNLFIDSYLVIKKDEELEKYNPEKHEKLDITFNRDLPEKLSWNNQVADLLELKSKQYKICRENDWYSEYKFYISEYGQANEKIVICCYFEKPGDKEVEETIENIKRVSEGIRIKNVIIAINSMGKINYVKKYNDYEIRFISEGVLLDELVDFSNYSQKVIRDFEKNEIIKGYKTSISDIFVKPSCKKFIRKGNEVEKHKIIDIETHIEEWLLDSKSQKQLAILGEYGQGKSVLAQWIAYLMFKTKIESDRIPIIIELRGKYPKQYSSMTDFLASWSSTYGIDPLALYKLYLAGRLLIVFDGFDEMELVGDKSIRLEHFRKIWSFGFEKSKMIITGRPNFFLNNHELNSLLRLHKSIDSIPYCEEIHIEKFDFTQIESSLRASDEKIKESILSIIRNKDKNKSFYDLVSRPALLFLTSTVWEERKLYKYKDKINSCMVIKEFINNSYSRQNSKGDYTPLGIFGREFFMQGIAIGMCLESGYTNQISATKLREVIDKLYYSFPEVISEYEQSVSRRNLKSLKERYESIYNKETIFRDIIACGILVRDLSSFDSFKFAHKSFLEYYISNFYVSLINQDLNKDSERDIAKINSIKNTLGVSKKDIVKNPEVLKFSGEMLAASIELKDGSNLPQVVYKLLSSNKLLKMLNYGHFLKYLNFMKLLSTKIIYIYLITVIIIGFILFQKRGENFFKFINVMSGTLSGFIIFTLEKKVFLTLVDKNSSKREGCLSDRHNLLLWYITCLELGVSMEKLEKKIPYKLKENLKERLEVIF